MIYGYARCSTNDKKQDVEGQIRELKSKGAVDDTIYKEYESGTKADRTELNKLLNVVKKNDTIVTTEVSRLARSTKQFVEILDFVQSNNIRLEIGSLILDCREGKNTDMMTLAMLQIVSVFAELERNMISQRVKRGMDNARAKGKEIGRPTTTLDDIPQAFKKNYKLYKDKKINKSELARICNISRTTLYKYIKIIEEQ